MTTIKFDIWITPKKSGKPILFHHELTSDEMEEMLKQKYLSGEEGLPMYVDTEGMKVEVATDKVTVH